MDVHHPGRRQKCVRVRGSGTRVCTTRFPGAAEKAWRADRIEHIVRDRCTGKCKFRTLVTVLTSNAMRESSMRPWVRHKLNPDSKANRLAYLRYAKTYGHERVKHKSRITLKDTGNPHYADKERWSFGLGYYGMIAAGWVATWDRMAPPEILCREPVAIEVWLRRARGTLRKVAGGVDCEGYRCKPNDPETGKTFVSTDGTCPATHHRVRGDGKKDFWGSATSMGTPIHKPAMYDITHAISSGRLCPGPKSKARFARKMRAYGVAPFGRIRLRDLGTPVPRHCDAEDPDCEDQASWLERISTELDAAFAGPPKPSKKRKKKSA